VMDTKFNGGRHNFPAVKVPRQCTSVLLVKADCNEGEAFGSGAVREVEQYHAIFAHNF
jgi:hypothetical protein